MEGPAQPASRRAQPNGQVDLPQRVSTGCPQRRLSQYDNTHDNSGTGNLSRRGELRGAMAPTYGAVTVLIADADDARSMLADVLSEFDDCQVVAVAADAEQAIDLAAQHCPQIALLHVDVPGGG